MAKDKNHVYNICMWTDQLQKGVIPSYAEYKSNGGELPWKAFRHALSIGDISMEALNEQ